MKGMAGGPLSVAKMTREDFISIMDPIYYTEMSPVMIAILQHILGVYYGVDPQIEEINVSQSSNGGLLTTRRGYIGSVYDYIMNVNTLLDVNKLDDEAKAIFWDLAERKIPIRATLGIECFAKEER